MNRREFWIGAAAFAAGAIIGVRIGLLMWQVTIAVFEVVPFFDPMALLVNFITTWVLTGFGCVLMADGFRRASAPPAMGALTQMPAK
jgi:hypothetical protein